MRLLSIIALTATLSTGLVSVADAATTRPNNPPGPNTTDLVCVATCPPRHADSVTQPNCSDKLMRLPHLTARDILAVGEDQRLHVAPICDLIANHSLADARTHDMGAGNVAGLRAAIERNPLLMNELSSHGYDSNDVFGILIGVNAAVLYVHKV